MINAYMFQLISKYIFLFEVGGFLYIAIEFLWRGYSHWSMFVLGGICFLFCGIQNEFTPKSYPLVCQALISDVFVVSCELVTGCIVNLKLGWNVWDYSDLPFNILGQSCPQYFLLFFPLCILGIMLDDFLRFWIFGEDKPEYKIF